jgi:hypothetical protein
MADFIFFRLLGLSISRGTRHARFGECVLVARTSEGLPSPRIRYRVPRVHVSRAALNTCASPSSLSFSSRFCAVNNDRDRDRNSRIVVFYQFGFAAVCPLQLHFTRPTPLILGGTYEGCGEERALCYRSCLRSLYQSRMGFFHFCLHLSVFSIPGNHRTFGHLIGLNMRPCEIRQFVGSLKGLPRLTAPNLSAV